MKDPGLHRIPDEVGRITRRTAGPAPKSHASIVVASLRADAEVELADLDVVTQTLGTHALITDRSCLGSRSTTALVARRACRWSLPG
jgi:hypothetical protein